MPKSWTEVEQSPEYSKMPVPEQLQAKQQYFDSIVSVKPEYSALPDEEKQAAKQQFLGNFVDNSDGGQSSSPAFDPMNHPFKTAFTPISKLVTGKSIGERTDLLNKSGNAAVNQADLETQKNLNAQKQSGARPVVPPKTPSQFDFFMKQLPAATGQALINTADITPADVATLGTAKAIAPVRVAGAEVGDIASKMALGNPFSKAGRNTMKEGLDVAKEATATRDAAQALVQSEKNAAIYRNVLAPSKGEISKVEIKQGKDLNDYYKLAADEGLIIKKSPDNKLDTSDARAQLQEKTTALNQQLNDALQSKQKPTEKNFFNLDAIGDTAKKDLRSRIKNDADYESAIAHVDKEISAAKGQRAQYIDGPELNTVKQGMWSKSYNILEPNSNIAARAIGFAAKDAIEKAYPDKNIQGINQQLGKYLTLDTLLDNAHGRVISKGKLGKYVAQGVGALVGHALHLPVIGEFGGAWLGGKVNDFITNPERITGNIARQSEGLKNPLSENTVTPTMTGTQLSSGTDKPISSPFNPLNKQGVAQSLAEKLKSEKGSVDIGGKNFDESQIKSMIEKAGGKFKQITDMKNSLYDNEPTIYFDDAKGSTKTIRPSQLNDENIKLKMEGKKISDNKNGGTLGLNLFASGAIGLGALAGNAQASEPIKAGQELQGKASTYGWGEKLNPLTFSGERFKPEGVTVAMRGVPMGTKVEITDPRTNKTIKATVNDGGPAKRLNRVVDLSQGAWKELGYGKPGLVNVKIKILELGKGKSYNGKR